MKYYSTSKSAAPVTLAEAVIKGLADDNGLFMPEQIGRLPEDFLRGTSSSFADTAFIAARALIGDDIPSPDLEEIIHKSFNFEAPLVEISRGFSSLELFHGPTLAFKDFGARFMAALLEYFTRGEKRDIRVLVATSGDTGSAVASGFLNKPGISVVILYPSRKVSMIQEKQLTTLGGNITALEVDGTFDDCQRMVKQAFLDRELGGRFFLTSANSINIARLIPQSFYYIHSWFQLKDRDLPLVFSVPGGNFGNLTAGLIAKRMGLPVSKFIASTNANDIVPAYLESGKFDPKPSVQTISNAMDVGNPSNFARMMDLYGEDRAAILRDVTGYSFTDAQTEAAIREVQDQFGYLCDPHGAIGYLGLKEYVRAGNQDINGIFLETAHPAKFIDVVTETTGKPVTIPERLKECISKEKVSVPVPCSYEALREYLMK